VILVGSQELRKGVRLTKNSHQRYPSVLFLGTFGNPA